MKTLRKVSFENFERLTIVEASQLYGGTGDNPPPTPMPTDSIPTNKNDSVPVTPVPKTTPKQSIGAKIKSEPNKSITFEGSYKATFNNGFYLGVTGGYNTKTGGQGTLDFGYNFGGKKK